MTAQSFPDFSLTGQVALVTGAARGLGRAISLALANAGADLALGLRDVHTGDSLAKEIRAMGRKALPLQMDVTNLKQISSAVEKTVSEFGRLDILVNNAGIAPENLAENYTEADFDATLAVNLKGTFFASQAAGRVMIRQKRGRIINLGSQAGSVALPGEPIYCMTKAAISHLTKCLAVEWGKHNITVNTIAPTFISTPGTDAALADPAFAPT
ncbi:MAG TPA: SDR family NAD(P)-dependent oxidoreductase, partial [Candidatus Acidoferrum sp.]|nr:SDR family NAD(P)-dependent oxidoreductase [Candidatus Acidoferrum sp.]